MKRKLLLLALAGLLAACGNSNPQEHKILDSPATEAGESHEENKPLVLDNGQKWKVDQATHNNLVNLQNTAKAFEASAEKSLEDYQEVRLNLADGITKMVTDCRMTGPAHEALHHWLKPFINDVAALKNAKTQEEAQGSYRTVTTQLQLNTKYFE